jgi:hypothetical protein
MADPEVGLGTMARARRLPATTIPATYPDSPATYPDSIERTSAGIARTYAGDPATDAMIGPDVLDTPLRLAPA